MPDDSPTNKQLDVPVILVVGGRPDLTAVVEEAAVMAQALVTGCAVADAATVAAEIRPLAIVMSDEVYRFDPDAFEALARDVQSRLLAIREEEHRVGTLESMLKALMAEGCAGPDGAPRP